MLSALGAVFVLAVACSAWFGLRAYELRGSDAAQNAALADADATDEVIEQVSDSLRSVFSYDYTNLDRTERAVEEALTGEAEREYLERFDALSQRAEEQELIRTSTVRSIGVRELTDEKATLLVFLDQQERRADLDTPESQSATLNVTATMERGAWRVSRIEPV